MPSNIIQKPWDYIRDNRAIIDQSQYGVWAIYSWDPFIEKMLVYNIRNFFKKQRNVTFQILIGSEISKEWVEDNMNSITLFGGHESFIILSADDIKPEVQELIGLYSSKIDQRLFIFLFDQKANFLLQNIGDTSLIFDQPPYWDNRRLLDFIALEMKITMSAETLNYVFEVVEPTIGNFVMALNLLRLNATAGKNLSSLQVQELLIASKLDQFQLAEMINEKDWRSFYESLVHIQLDVGGYAKLFAFLVSHLLKLRDPSYIAKKKRPSKYDLRLEQIAKAWKSSEIDGAIEVLGELALLSRTNKDSFSKKIKLLALEQLF